MDENLISRIYECAFAPELWPLALAEIADLAEARGSLLLTSNTDGLVLRWAASASLRELTAGYVATGKFLQDSRAHRWLAARHAGFLTDGDIYTSQELETDPTRRAIRAAGLGYSAFMGAPLPTGDWFVFSIQRDAAGEPFEASTVGHLDALRPHLARSALMSTRLQMERAQMASETLELIGLPGLVFDSRGTVLAANHLIEELTDHITWRARGCVSLKDRTADNLFQSAIATLHMDQSGQVRSFAVRGTHGDGALVAHIVPIRRTARDIFVRCAGVLIMTPVTLPQAPPVELVESLFDLTPAEARVARGLAAGDTLDQIASIGSVSRNTVRTQVRGVLEKTGCRRQAEVVALLSGIAVRS